MSSNKFLQRFEGKIHIVGKTGIQGLFGDNSVTLYTNHQFYHQQNKTCSSLNKLRSTHNAPKPPVRSTLQNNEHSQKKPALKMPSIHSRQSQRFSLIEPSQADLVDQQEEQAKKQISRKPTLQEQGREVKRTSNYNSSRSLEKRKDKEYSHSGGLGANIGGEEWVLRKNKLDKMQLFAQQVKQANTKPKVPKQRKDSIVEKEKGDVQILPPQ